MLLLREAFSALKMGGSQGPVRFVDTPKAIDTMVARVAAVREAVGDEVDIAVSISIGGSVQLWRRSS